MSAREVDLRCILDVIWATVASVLLLAAFLAAALIAAVDEAINGG